MLDVFINILVIVYVFVLRPFLTQPPPMAKMLAWPFILIGADFLLLHGLNATSRLFLLVLWQIAAAFNIMLLSAVAVFFAIFALPDIHGFARRISEPNSPKHFVLASTALFFVGCVVYVAYTTYCFRLVNGAKIVMREAHYERQATRASRIMVRRQSEPVTVATVGSGNFIHGDVDFEFSQTLREAALKRIRSEDMTWIHQDVFSASSAKSRRTTMSEVAVTQPLSDPSNHVNPMRPFFPLYPVQPRVASTTTLASRSNRVGVAPSDDTLIMPAHCRRASN